jgi:hypothetical protein
MKLLLNVICSVAWAVAGLLAFTVVADSLSPRVHAAVVAYRSTDKVLGKSIRPDLSERLKRAALGAYFQNPGVPPYTVSAFDSSTPPQPVTLTLQNCPTYTPQPPTLAQVLPLLAQAVGRVTFSPPTPNPALTTMFVATASAADGNWMIYLGGQYNVTTPTSVSVITGTDTACTQNVVQLVPPSPAWPNQPANIPGNKVPIQGGSVCVTFSPATVVVSGFSAVIQ